MKKYIFTSWMCLLIGTSLGWAGILASWDASGLSDAQVLAGDYTAKTNDPKVVVSNLIAASGLLRTGGGPAASTFTAAGYSTGSFTAAMAAGHYWSFSIRAVPGQMFSLTNLIYSFRAPASGPKTGQWAWSYLADSGFMELGSPQAIDNGWNRNYTIDLESFAALQNTAGPIYLRFAAWGGQAGVTAWGGFGQATNTITLQGETKTYAPQPPVVIFTPPSAQTVMVSNSVSITHAVVDGGVTSRFMTPTPSSGSTNFTASTLNFTPNTADFNKVFTYSIVATNANGTRTSSIPIAVAAYRPSPPSGSYQLTFENLTKNSYSAAMLTNDNQVWQFRDVVVGVGSWDRKFENKSAQFSQQGAALTSQGKLLTNGIGSISLYYAAYGDNGTNSFPVMAVEVSKTLFDDDGLWMPVGQFDTSTALNVLSLYEMDVSIPEPVYVRFRIKEGTGKANIDNIAITPYVAPSWTSYEQYLLRYNVTPGDPGTALSDDLDDDGYTNSQEQNAGTNPYDATSHP